ncbi:D-hexose-6-phosphate mutarotase [Carboxylicivirga sp. N1Y90]|uniref:D-hexose-6-phosphate mutarotase n=1 Tax=Carboxylicivirga fragile TaxID=3417571 RepID=UPI003D33DD61|nr:D-hexose-6-phosphate mutarotase [Marinilabiliaceae bacterium N1Y90]
MDLITLNKEYGCNDNIRFIDEYHTIIAEIKNKYATVKVSLYGAQVLSFKPHDQDEILFMSSQSYFEDGKAIRGGIPVCWPWFGSHPNNEELPSHGFARISTWKVVSCLSTNDAVTLKLGLTSNASTLKLWPFVFNAELVVKLGKELSVSLITTNKNDVPFEISSALHSYFKLSDFSDTSLKGLKDTAFLDDVSEKEGLQKEELLRFSDRIDCRYRRTESPCLINDKDRQIKVEKRGSEITVVWNPGKQLSAEMKDLGDQDYKHMLCVEAANSLEDTITVQAGKKHTLETIISIV